ncbi:MAG: hypothetical protein AABX01_00830, partial [Candidatus Micrarchaeota archaeon]
MPKAHFDYSAKVVLPRVGARFKLEHLPPITKALYLRKAQLSGHKVERLLPIRITTRDTRPGYYDRHPHSIHVNETENMEVLEEEGLHSSQAFAPSHIPEQAFFIEPSAKVHKTGREDFYYPMFMYFLHHAREKFDEKLDRAQIRAHNTRIRIARKYFIRHGIDGLLLLHALPFADVITLGSWEKR